MGIVKVTSLLSVAESAYSDLIKKNKWNVCVPHFHIKQNIRKHAPIMSTFKVRYFQVPKGLNDAKTGGGANAISRLLISFVGLPLL